MRPSCTASDSSWPGLSRPSTPFSQRFSKQGGDGRDKPGHDDVNGLQIPRVGMSRALILAGAAALVVGLMAAPEQAQAVCSVLSHHPCTPAFGSVLSHHPFTPYYCGVFSRPGCTPEIFYPLNQVPVLKVEGHVGPSEAPDRDHPADRINELGPLLSKCLELPPDDEAQAGMRVTLKLAFKRDGELLADPRFTYTTHNAPDKVKAAYHDAALDMLKHCTPLPITDKLGGAIAGRPFVVAIKDTRNLHAGDTGSADAPGDSKP
jgi:hypothetical protein